MSQEREPRDRTLELDRLVNFSDAVFAIAATVLVLSVHIPLDLKGPDLDEKLWDAFQDSLPQVLTYALSFFIIGRNWLAHHRMFRVIRRIDGRFIAINLILLGFIALLPFPTEAYGNYPGSKATLIVYAASISATGLASVALWWYASQDNRLIDPSTPRMWITHAHLRGLSIPAVFLLSIPVALVSVTAAQITWALLIPLRAFFVRRYGKITEIW
jgi:TMEM175 potassium channel family protein